LDPLIFIKYFLEKKISLSHCITKEKKTKKKLHLLSPNTPSHTTKRIIPWNFLEIPPSYLQKQPNFSLPCHPRNNHLG
jgi:hypothetical protein